MSHELYVQVLSAMFLFWNGARVLTYIPTIGKLLTREADVRSYSLLSWGSWALSNGTFALMLLEMSRGIPDRMFWMNLANALMCLVVTFIILLKRFPRFHAQVNRIRQKIKGIETGSVPVSRRIGRRALWISSACALGAGIAGTFAYGVSFNHDQVGYVAPIASAPQASSSPAAASPAQKAPSSGETRLASAAPLHPLPVAAAAAAKPASSARVDRSAALAPDSGAPQQVNGRTRQASYVVTPNHHRSEPHVAPSPFTRVSLFFRRISYRQHGSAGQRIDYPHR